MTTTVDAKLVEHPLAPTTLEECGLKADLLLQLALKTLHFSGELTGVELARRLGLNFTVIEPYQCWSPSAGRDRRFAIGRSSYAIESPTQEEPAQRCSSAVTA
jgi:hypothetical protein